MGKGEDAGVGSMRTTVTTTKYFGRCRRDPMKLRLLRDVSSIGPSSEIPSPSPKQLGAGHRTGRASRRDGACACRPNLDCAIRAGPAAGSSGNLGIALGGLWESQCRRVAAEDRRSGSHSASLKAELPLTTAVWDRRFLVRKLVAKGWTLDLRQLPAPKAGESTESAPAPDQGQGSPATAERVSVPKRRASFLRDFEPMALPCDVSLDGVDLEAMYWSLRRLEGSRLRCT